MKYKTIWGDSLSDHNDLPPEKSKPTNFVIVDEPEEKIKGKGKPKRQYFPDHLVVNTKLVIGLFILLVFAGAGMVITRPSLTSQSSPMIFPRIITATAPPLDSLDPPPTATYPYVVIPTPTMRFNPSSEGWSYPVILTRPISNISSGSRVTIHTGRFNGTEWIYEVTDEGNSYAEVPESALSPLAHVTPTPTPVFQNLIGIDVYEVITIEQISNIPANTRVKINSAVFDGAEWKYYIQYT